MEKILESRFYMTVTELLSGNGSPNIVDEKRLWKEFTQMVAAGSECYSVKSYLRELFQVHIDLRYLLSQALGRKELRCVCLIRKALKTIEAEIDLIKLGLEYPHIDRPARGIVSTLYIAEGFSRTDLVEIIKGMHAIRFSRRGDGSFATLADLKMVLGAAFNVEFPRLDQNVHYTVNRSKGPAQFLTRLVDCLEELSRR